MRMQYLARLTCLITLLGAWPGVASATQLQPYLSGLDNPVFLTHAGDGSNRVFVVEQPGSIRVVQPGSTTPTLFLDISARVAFGGEQGLLGLAFHPQYVSNGRFFVDYTRKSDGATVIAEYHVSGNPNVANSTETGLLTIAQPFANHNGGMVVFGPDGYLYIGMGDGGAGNDPGAHAQDITNLLGKILRIDVNVPSGYASPATNPFFGATPGADEIFAVGMRNPWRYSFDRANGTLWVGDVGQNAWEEVDVVTVGGNYGWRVFEGNHCTGNDPGLCSGTYIAPVTEYFHDGGRCSITGGYVYRGSAGALPVGEYVYGDYCSGEILLLSSGVLFDTPLFISSFGEDEAGEMYVVSLDGTIVKFVAGTCGDGGVDNGEQCDDGNSAGGDGCSSSCQSELIPDPAPNKTDCLQEWLTTPVTPPTKKGLPSNQLTCVDDDPLCDFGTAGDQTCTFHVALCLNVPEQRFACTPTDVARVQLLQPNQLHPRDAIDAANRDALEGALAGISGTVRGECTNHGVKQHQPCIVSADCDSLSGSGDGRCKGRVVAFESPLITSQCTASADVAVPVKQTAKGARPGKTVLRLSAKPSRDPVTGANRPADSDSLKLVCNPKP